MPTEQKIRYSDCDPQGIVFNGNYARYWDDAATDWMEEAGLGVAELGALGLDVVTARLEIDFKRPATLGDTLVTSMTVERFGTTSMTVNVATSRRSDHQLVAEGKLVWVLVDPETFKSVAVPDVVKETLG